MKVYPSLIAVVAVLVVVPTVVGRLTPSQCDTQKKNLENTCRNVAVTFGGLNPSAACCQLVRAANVECVCPSVSSKLVAALGGAQRCIRLVQSCGRPIPRNFKCGSLTTPP